MRFPCCDLVVCDAASCGGGAMEEGMEKMADDEEVDCLDSYSGRGSWDC